MKFLSQLFSYSLRKTNHQKNIPFSWFTFNSSFRNIYQADVHRRKIGLWAARSANWWLLDGAIFQARVYVLCGDKLSILGVSTQTESHFGTNKVISSSSTLMCYTVICCYWKRRLPIFIAYRFFFRMYKTIYLIKSSKNTTTKSEIF